MTGRDFEPTYAAALTAHVTAPGERGLRAAYELGRRALDADLSMLELVGIHLRARRTELDARGLDVLDDLDAFLREALAAFEITQRGYIESQRAAADARHRAELLRGLSEAYVKIAAAGTFAERIEQVCVQAQAFLDAEDARLEFGRRAVLEGNLSDLDEMAAALDGSGGRLVLRARPGRKWTDTDRATLAQLAVLISAPIDDARRLDFAQRLEQIGAMLAQAVDQQDIIHFLTETEVARVGSAGVSLWLTDDDDRVTSLGDPRSDVLSAVAQGAGAYFAQRGDDEAWAVLPLEGIGGRVGAVGCWYDDRQPFDAVQRDFLAQVADRVATSLERVRAYERERVARRDAEIASERFRSLQELASDLARAATRRRVGQILLRRAMDASKAVGGLVVSVADGRRVEPLAASGVFAAGTDDERPSLSEHMLAELHALGRQGEVIDLTATVRRRLESAGTHSVEVYPIAAGRRTVGLLALCWPASETDRLGSELVRAQVAVAGPALHRAERYDVEHDIADTLQRSILARPVVSLPGVRWSVHYRAGSAGLAGGDWYDLYPLDDHRLAIAVGDVVGQGVQAAAVMGQLRSATRAMAAIISDPGQLVTAVDDYVAKTGQGEYSSMAYLVLDTRTGELQHTLAGHPPPVLRLPDGSTELLESGRGPLLGIARERSTARRRIPRGTLIVLYTDGLVERRAETVDAGLDRLRATIAARGGDLEPDALCPTLAAALVPPDEAADDVAIVAVELSAELPPGV